MYNDYNSLTSRDEITLDRLKCNQNQSICAHEFNPILNFKITKFQVSVLRIFYDTS